MHNPVMCSAIGACGSICHHWQCIHSPQFCVFIVEPLLIALVDVKLCPCDSMALHYGPRTPSSCSPPTSFTVASSVRSMNSNEAGPSVHSLSVNGVCTGVSFLPTIRGSSCQCMFMQL